MHGVVLQKLLPVYRVLARVLQSNRKLWLVKGMSLLISGLQQSEVRQKQKSNNEDIIQ